MTITLEEYRRREAKGEEPNTLKGGWGKELNINDPMGSLRADIRVLLGLSTADGFGYGERATNSDDG